MQLSQHQIDRLGGAVYPPRSPEGREREREAATHSHRRGSERPWASLWKRLCVRAIVGYGERWELTRTVSACGPCWGGPTRLLRGNANAAKGVGVVHPIRGTTPGDAKISLSPLRPKKVHPGGEKSGIPRVLRERCTWQSGGSLRASSAGSARTDLYGLAGQK